MSSSPSLPSPKTAFGRAFLAELSRGNIELAILFAKAFLAQESRILGIIEEPPMLVIAS